VHSRDGRRCVDWKPADEGVVGLRSGRLAESSSSDVSRALKREGLSSWKKVSELAGAVTQRRVESEGRLAVLESGGKPNSTASSNLDGEAR